MKIAPFSAEPVTRAIWNRNDPAGLLFVAAAVFRNFRHEAVRAADFVAPSLRAAPYRTVPAVRPLVDAILAQVVQAVPKIVHNTAPPLSERFDVFGPRGMVTRFVRAVKGFPEFPSRETVFRILPLLF